MSPSTPLFGPRRNPLLSKWNTLFDSNPKEWISFRPALGLNVYPCYACRHMFSSHKSFKDHINRRAVLLQYKCPGCEHLTSCPFTFLNRCSLLLHARKHFTLQRGEINLKNLEVDLLPLELAGFLPNPEVPIIFGDEENLIDSNIYINAQFYAPKLEDKGKEIITLMPNDLVINKAGEEMQLALKQLCRNLPYCQFIALDEQKRLRSQNLLIEVKQEPEDVSTENSQDVNSNDTNNNSDMTLPVIAKIESLQEGTKCVECNVFVECSSLKEHFLEENKPRDDGLKCTVCKYVAPTECSLSAHERIHEHLPPFVCPECGHEYPSYPKLQKHMDDICFHLAKNVRFRCPGKKCGKLFAMSQTYAAHFAVHMSVVYRCNECKEVCISLANFEMHVLLHKDDCGYDKLFECTVCSLSGLNSEQCKKHIQWHSTDRERCMYVYLCRYCKSYFRSTLTYSQHLTKCTKNDGKHRKRNELFNCSKYASGECILCHCKIIYVRDKNVKVCVKCKPLCADNKPVERCFCILCKTQITLDERKMHQKQCRYGHPQVILEKLQSNSDKSISSSTSSSDLEGSPSKKRNNGDPNRKRHRLHNRMKKPQDDELDLTAEEPIHFDGTYRCKLCDFIDMERENFHKHIKAHRDISTSFQCMECGECFVVKPSLIKHLLHFHNIADHENYFKVNDCFDEGAVKELAQVVKLAPYIAKDTVKETQCKVCLEEFPTKDELDTHFRKHGMAFLARNSL